jgi:YfiH family protein
MAVAWRPWGEAGGPVLEWRWQPPGSEAVLVAGVTTRLGGVSRPPYDSFNLGFGSGDAPAAVAENWRRWIARHGVAAGRLWRARQVHGSRVADTAELAPVADPAALPETAADGIVAWERRQWVSILVADCVPLFVWAPDLGAAAVVHSGWRGTAAGIARAAVRALTARGARPDRLWAGIGPCIGPCCYEVDEPVRRAFADQGHDLGSFTPLSAPERYRLDLVRANRWLLEEEGVPGAQVEASGLCTACHPDWFYSYRRDGPASGRMGAVVWLR